MPKNCNQNWEWFAGLNKILKTNPKALLNFIPLKDCKLLPMQKIPIILLRSMFIYGFLFGW